VPSFDFLSEPLFWLTGLAAFAAAMIRGFSGFGSGMIFMPVAAACLGPRLAAGAFLIVDTVLIAPLVVRAMKRVEWREVLPMGLAGMVMVPVGAAVLLTLDPVPLRWGISIACLGFVAVLAAGWRYRGRSRAWASALVGASAGFLSGSVQIPGPPVILYWLGRDSVAATMRANAMVVFCFTTVVSIIAYLAGGIFTGEVLARSVVLLPVYAAGLFVGSRLFGLASEATYRRIAYAAMIFVAVLSLPVFG
jgi:uncharacterized membrane protein YfcA